MPTSATHRQILVIGTLATLLGTLTFPLRMYAAQPQTIPALKQWTDASGQYVFSENTRIVVDGAYASELSETAATFANDLLSETGIPISVSTGAAPSAGDLFLTLGVNDPDLGNEGYLLDIADSIRISAAAPTGVFYGTRSILQMLRQNTTINGGSAVDWPDYAERALMVDVGRKFFSMDFLRAHIRELAYLKLNYFHLHLSDVFDGGSGFRLESIRHPEITSPDHYTRAEIQELLALAAKYHVMIVPEIDVPSHAAALLANHPDLGLSGRGDKLDLGNPASYTLVQDLLEEFLPLFPAPYWHTGADEYLAANEYSQYPQLQSYARTLYGPSANGPDVYIGFVNWIDGIVKAHGKQLRVWNDVYGVTGAVNTPNSDIVLEMWWTFITPQNALSNGHEIVNAQLVTLYYVLGNSEGNPANLYESWQPNRQWVLTYTPFTWAQDLSPQTPGLRGGKFHVWCDNPNAETEAQVTSGIGPNLRGLAQNAWGSPKLTPSYSAFQNISAAIGHAPAFAPDFTMVAQSASETVRAGQTATFAVDLAALQGNQTISLSCTTPARASICTVMPGSVTIDTSRGSTASVSVTTAASSSAALFGGSGLGMPAGTTFVAILFPALLGLKIARPRRRAFRAASLVAAGVLLFAVGCGGGGGSPAPPPSRGTLPGSYTIVLRGTSGILTHTINMTMTVQ